MMETIPSTVRKAVKITVSVSAPDRGKTNKTIPATIPTTADNNDQPNPGDPRVWNVMTNPSTPLSKINQPINSSTVTVAKGGTQIAIMPKMISTIPSIRKNFQCARREFVIAVSGCLTSILSVDMVHAPSTHA